MSFANNDITLRRSKGLSLTYDELDDNFKILEDRILEGVDSNDITSKTTDDLDEGSTNLYYTNARADGRVNALVTKTFVDGLGVRAASADKLHTARTIALSGDVTGSVSFNGTSNVTINATALHAEESNKLATPRTIALSGDVTGSVSFDGSSNVTINTAVVNDSHTHSFDELTGKESAVSSFATTGHLVAGLTSGSVALTTNDGYGNANITFNHRSGVPDSDGSSGRIHVDTDGDIAVMRFKLASNVTSGVAVSATDVMRIKESEFSVEVPNFVHNGSNVYSDNYHPNADTLTTARTITLSGDASGSVSFDGSSNVTLNANVTYSDNAGKLDNIDSSQFLRSDIDVDMNGNIHFPERIDDLMTFWKGEYAFGLQASTLYARTFKRFSIHKGGSFVSSENDPGVYVDPEGVDPDEPGVTLFTVTEDQIKYLTNDIFHDGYHPNADKLTTARTITLGGDLSGSVSFDGSSNVTINATVDGAASMQADIDSKQTIYRESITITNNSYTRVARVNGDYLGAMITMTVTGTSNSVVMASQFDIIVHHLGKIQITSRTGDYTPLLLKVTCANSHDFDIWLQHTGSTTPTQARIEIHPMNGETVIWNPTAGTYGAGELIHTTKKNEVVYNQLGNVDVDISTTGVFYANDTQRVFADNYHPNADKLTTARTITLAGDVTGSVSFDGSSNVTITTTGGSASNADKLDNLNSTQFMRSDVADTMTGTATFTSGLVVSGTEPDSNEIKLVGDSPQIKFMDNTSGDDFWIHVNSGNFYVLTDRDATNTWETPHPLQLRNSNTDGFLYGSRIFTDTYHPDADKLGGLTSSQFVRSDANDSISGKLTLNGQGSTIAGSNWDNGWLKIGTSTTGWSFDSNEMYNSGTGIIGTMNGGDMSLLPDGDLNISAGGSVKISGNLAFHDGYHPNADKLTTARTISLGGDLSGSASFNGTSNITITGTVADNSHNHTSLTGVSLISGASVSTRDKYRVWGGTPYTIGMDSGYSFGGLNNDFAMTFQMNNDADRGFWWGDDGDSNAQGAMALTTDGKLTVASFVRIGYGSSDTTIPATHALDINGTVMGNGDIMTTRHVEAGYGSGSIAMTVNDGYGNANITFNHKNGVPDGAGNALRIETNVDATSDPTMVFEMKANVAAGTGTSLNRVFQIKEHEVLIDSTGKDALSIQKKTNGGGIGIKFTDASALTQWGKLCFYHQDSESAGGKGATFKFETSEGSLGIDLPSNGDIYRGTEKFYHDTYHPDADKVGGYAANISEVANNVAVRNGSGDIFTRLIRSSYANQNNVPITAGINFRNNNSSDNYIRTASPSGFRDYCGANGIGVGGLWTKLANYPTRKYNGTITLSQSMLDFDFVVIRAMHFSYVEETSAHFYFSINSGDWAWDKNFYVGGNGWHGIWKWTNATTLTYVGEASSWIKSVWGVKM